MSMIKTQPWDFDPAWSLSDKSGTLSSSGSCFSGRFDYVRFQRWGVHRRGALKVRCWYALLWLWGSRIDYGIDTILLSWQKKVGWLSLFCLKACPCRPKRVSACAGNHPWCSESSWILPKGCQTWKDCIVWGSVSKTPQPDCLVFPDYNWISGSVRRFSA